MVPKLSEEEVLGKSTLGRLDFVGSSYTYQWILKYRFHTRILDTDQNGEQIVSWE